MCFYARVVFPRLCDLVLNTPVVRRARQAALAPAFGNVLEIGFGTGLNLPHYPPGVRRVTALDPNEGMHRLARQRIRRARVRVDSCVVSGEHLPFPDNSFDCVVSTFTLCSIDQVQLAIAEAWRVLGAGGRFVFLEHGLSPDPTVQKWQRRLNWLEMLLAGGCHLDRDMQQLVSAQPFARLDVEQSYLPGVPATHGYLYRGVAYR